jgi:endonuclease YncB( thermonuclease family)
VIRRFALAALALAVMAGAGEARSHVRVIDGDTMRIADVSYRLFGIDAPEIEQTCNGWRAGIEAEHYLTQLITGKHVQCEMLTTDRYGRTVARCRADGTDLGAAMVRAGMAWAFIRYSAEYVGQEAHARFEKLGVHGAGCEAAWDYRRSHLRGKR